MKRIFVLFIISLSMGTMLNSCGQSEKRSQKSIPVANKKLKQNVKSNKRKKWKMKLLQRVKVNI